MRAKYRLMFIRAGWCCVALSLSVMLSSCANVKNDQSKVDGSVVKQGSPAAPVNTVPQTPPAPPQPAVPEAPAPAAAPVDVRMTLLMVRNQLNQGDEAAALVALKRVLEAEPDNKTALSFMRQIQEDPKVLYGRASYPYRVVAGDMLALIAQRRMSDADQFYGLARYNGMKVPGDLKVGQTIQIPGTIRQAPAASHDPGPSTTPASGSTARADDTKAADEKNPADEKNAADDKKAVDEKRAAAEKAAVQARTKEISRLMTLARVAMKRQDICGAIRQFDAVLKLDPDHQAAQLERTRAVELNTRLGAKQC